MSDETLKHSVPYILLFKICGTFEAIIVIDVHSRHMTAGLVLFESLQGLAVDFFSLMLEVFLINFICPRREICLGQSATVLL